MKENILHAFEWKLSLTNDRMPEIYDMGYTALQLTSVQPFKYEALLKEQYVGDHPAWYDSFQATDFSVGNYYGIKEKLKSLTYNASSYGIKTIIDLICNHMANEGPGELELVRSHTINKELLENDFFWKKNQENLRTNNRYDVVTKSIGLPCLATDNYDLMEQYIFPFLKELMDCGVMGFRFDAAKHIALPNDPNDVKCDFWPKTIEFINNYMAQKGINPNDMLIYGETLNLDSKATLEQYMQYIKVLIDWDWNLENKNGIIRFAETHDTYLPFVNNKNESKDIMNTSIFDDNQIVDRIIECLNNNDHVIIYPRYNVWNNPRLREVMRNRNPERFTSDYTLKRVI